ncbi:MAG TPA: dihydrolipoamide acetyltransferase family protein [Streptosporangiaceae bacterium]|jgi:pyruvate dehydrogenase E2 component (dihydrolipoamide acetyltransferase)|nr:dihydrolipoamide acetyltransferase family protein [Streptosporangiaceae bacterium]
MTEVREFRLPDVGEGLTEADIVTWRIKPGDRVSVNQIIVDIETAKAVVELPSPYDGVVTGLLVSEGDTVDVGTPIIAIDVSDDAPVPDDTTPAQDAAAVADPGVAAGRAAVADPAAIAAAGPRPGPDDLVPPPPAEAAVEPGITGSPAPKAQRQAVLVGYGVKLAPTTRRPRKATPPAGLRNAGPVSGPAPEGAGVLAKPPVRKLARELGVDLTALAGTGPGGSVTRQDVQAALVGAGSGDLAPARPGALAGISAVPREERIAVRGVRKHTAAAVSASAFTAPHVTEFLQVDVDATMAAVQRLRDLPDFAGIRVSPLLLVAKAVLVAAGRHPMINSTWDEDAQEIIVKHYVNLGIAAATDRGLIVPNIKDAHALSLPGLARALTGLATTAREGKSSPADLTGGTITITNVGVFGVDAGTPILTPPEAAILAFGQVKQAPWVVDGQLAVRHVTTLSLSFDHRIVDGDLGSAVLRDIGDMLHDPLRMLAWS